MLLRTYPKSLHEVPLRGEPGRWTWRNGKGGDLLGKLLTELRYDMLLNSKKCDEGLFLSLISKLPEEERVRVEEDRADRKARDDWDARQLLSGSWICETW